MTTSMFALNASSLQKASRARSLVRAVGPLLLLLTPAIQAQVPSGYYDTVNASNASTLRSTLHAVVDDHTRFPYSSSSTDTWDILNLAQEDPAAGAKIIDVYKNASYTKVSGGVASQNREHTWPKSYGFPDDGSSNYPYTDCHHLFLSDVGYNSDRGNKPFRDCTSGCSERSTLANDGRGGGSGTYPGNSNWFEDSSTMGSWQTWAGRQGDVARAIFYMDIRYEGGSHGGTGVAEPDLRLTDNELLISSSATGNNESVAYMGMLADLLAWHLADPVDDRERWKNEVVFGFQGNRNPFVDHPEWVGCLYGGTCGLDTTPPPAPSALVASASGGSVSLDWLASVASDLAGYNLYRATSSGGPYSKINSALLSATATTDGGVSAGQTYYYVVRAVDNAGNESGSSNEAAVTVQGSSGGGGLLLSEVFYDPTGSDNGYEWVELFNAGSAAVNLSGYSLGSGGSNYTYSKMQLSGVIGPGETFVVGGTISSSKNHNPTFDQSANFGPDIQNSGSTADGVALFDRPSSQVSSSTVPIDAVVYGGTNSNGLRDSSGSPPSPHVGDAPSGSSIERTDATTWQVQSAPTPNASPLGGSGGGTGVVILSEVFYDPSGSDSGYEWVELYNAGTAAVDLSGYSLGNGGTSYIYSQVQLSGVIGPGQTFVVGGTFSSSKNHNPSFDLSLDFGPDFQNSGSTADGVALFDRPSSQVGASTVPIDAVIYGGSNNNGLIDASGGAPSPLVGDAPSGSSIERIASGWRVQSAPTPNSPASGL